MAKHYTLQVNLFGKPLYPTNKFYKTYQSVTNDITNAYFTDNVDEILKLKKGTAGTVMVFDDESETLIPLEKDSNIDNSLQEKLKRASAKNSESKGFIKNIAKTLPLLSISKGRR